MILALFVMSCNSTKYLSNDEHLLKETKIIFKSTAKLKNKKSLEAELMNFIIQKPNEKLLFFVPKEWIYLRNNQLGDTTWLPNGLRSLGQTPAIYNEEITAQTAKNMESYLRFKKGFYDARVGFIVEEKQQIIGWETTSNKEVWQSNKSYVTYIIATGDRFKVKNVTYVSEDKRIIEYLESIRNEAFVKKGDYIDYSQFEFEKSRISVSLQNNGYASFSNNYIEINGDSSNVSKDVEIFFEIKTPINTSEHIKYTTGKINVYTDYHKDQGIDDVEVDSSMGISFYRQSNSFLVKPQLLNNSVFFREGSLLRREDRQKTFRKLNSLGTYRFVTINAQADTEIDSVMNFNVLLSPYQNKWILDGALEGYFSTLGASRLFGVSLSSSLQNRNMFGGSERYSLRAELGTEIGRNKEANGYSFIQRTRNVSIQNNLNIPSFQDFIGLGKMVNKVGLIKEKFYRNFLEESTTNIALGYSSLNILKFYSLSSFNASFGFDYTSNRGNRYIFRPLGFNLDLYDILDPTRFENNPLILLSFKDNLGTGFLFRDYTYIYNGQKSVKGNSFTVINNFEVSGWEVYLSNQLYNVISGKTNEWVFADGANGGRNISFAKYVRYEFDGRWNKEINKTQSLASRLNIGIIVPFGKNAAAPFIRQFGVGGPNSLRAWNIKEAGPGGYRDPFTKIKSVPSIFVNQGDIKIEANFEYRFKVILLLDGALFVDAGNVWTLKEDPDRPNAAISTRLFNQFAIGAGYGLRLNFGFFNIRFDFGYKIRSPFKDDTKRSQWYSVKDIWQQGIGNVQVAVNYPF